MALRRPCQRPVFYRYILGMQSSNPLKEKGIDVHSAIETFFTTGELRSVKPYTDNFMQIMQVLACTGIKIQPALERQVSNDRCKGQIDLLFPVDNEWCVGEIKTSKPPSDHGLSDMRLELGFYAKIVNAKYGMAMYLGEGGYPKNRLFFEKFKPALFKRLDKELDEVDYTMAKGDFKRVQGKLCEWCDDGYKQMCGIELIGEMTK